MVDDNKTVTESTKGASELTDGLGDKVTKGSILAVLTSMANRFDNDIKNAKQHELEQYWHFKWDATKPLEINIYHFHDMLKLYGSFCRRWEEEHNGSCCVVERVRDTYLMPKIREFAELIRNTPN
jgi:hypothetical protein